MTQPSLRILITGANGFIGKNFLKSLDSDCYQVSVLDVDRDPVVEAFPLEKYYVQDITQPFRLDDSFDFVFHLAALNVTHVGKAEYAQYRRVNVEGTRNVVNGVRTRNFVLMSTGKVYAGEGNTADETAALDPKGDYEKSKLEAEEVCKAGVTNANLTVFRPVNIAGAGQAEKALLPVFFKNASQNLPIDIFAPRGTRMQMLDVDDIVGAFILLMEKGGRNEVYNLASREMITIEDLAAVIVELTRSSSAVNNSNDVEAALCEILAGKIEQELGWKARYAPREIIERYHESMKASLS